MKIALRTLYFALREWCRALKIYKNKDFACERKKAEIIRLIHSLEKGMCILNPRLGFGIEKIHKLIKYSEEFASLYGKDATCLYMACDVIESYIKYHKEKNYSDEAFDSICDKFENFKNHIGNHSGEFAGVLTVSKNEIPDATIVKNIFESRHSVRDFENKSVSKEEILEAIKMAQNAPSACNRQAVRVYVVSSDKICSLYDGNLSGIGGFAENTDKFILITGKLSAYRLDEDKQFVVSASIFASYLSIALNSYKIGSCIIQRPLNYSKQWIKMTEELSIPDDEQLVCMMAIGYLKDEYKVPVSKRYNIEEIAKFIV